MLIIIFSLLISATREKKRRWFVSFCKWKAFNELFDISITPSLVINKHQQGKSASPANIQKFHFSRLILLYPAAMRCDTTLRPIHPKINNFSDVITWIIDWVFPIFGKNDGDAAGTGWQSFPPCLQKYYITLNILLFFRWWSELRIQ